VTADIICNDTSISRNHAEIKVSPNGEGVNIKDLGSKYGTYLGEKAVKSSQNQSNSVESERLSK
jgi:pSer/pThr/pTyr-binding forkhead associated (FHA) protein